MANIDDYLVASYRCNGKGNSDADRDVLKDLSGNGHDIVLKNFGFTLGSGYEGGALVFDGIDDYGICENFPAINDFTFVYKRINLNPSKSTNCFLSKSVSTNQAQQFCSELAYSKNVYVRLGSKDIAVKDIYNPELSIVYVTKESYNGEMDLVSSNYTSTVDNLYIGTFSRGVQAYVWNGALYALDIYDRTLSDEYLQKALNRMNDIDINWKDGVGEVTDQHLTVSPGSGTGNAAVSFGSVMNKGLDRTLELEITTPKGVKKTLTVNQEGCRQAYITSDGKRWLTSDNRVYGVLKSDAPCQCNYTCPGVFYVRPDGSITDEPSNDCIGVVLNAQGKRFMIEKNEDSNESYVIAGSGKDSTYVFYWGEYNTDQTGITNYNKAHGDDVYGYLKSESGSYNGTPNLPTNVTALTNGALSDWKGEANSNVLKRVTTGGGSYTSYATIGHVLNTFLASADAKGYDDWYIPSCGQLSLIYMYLISVNNALLAIGGQQFNTSTTYWSSSEASTKKAWYVNFSNGRVDSGYGIASSIKNGRYRVRFIRDILP